MEDSCVPLLGVLGGFIPVGEFLSSHYLDRKTGEIVLYDRELLEREEGDPPEPACDRDQREMNRAIDDAADGRYVAIEPVSSDESYQEVRLSWTRWRHISAELRGRLLQGCLGPGKRRRRSAKREYFSSGSTVLTRTNFA